MLPTKVCGGGSATPELSSDNSLISCGDKYWDKLGRSHFLKCVRHRWTTSSGFLVPLEKRLCKSRERSLIKFGDGRRGRRGAEITKKWKFDQYYLPAEVTCRCSDYWVCSWSKSGGSRDNRGLTGRGFEPQRDIHLCPRQHRKPFLSPNCYIIWS